MPKASFPTLGEQVAQSANGFPIGCQDMFAHCLHDLRIEVLSDCFPQTSIGFHCFLHRPQNLGDALLLGERWKSELKVGETAPICARRERSRRSSNGVPKKPVGEADKW